MSGKMVCLSTINIKVFLIFPRFAFQDLDRSVAVLPCCYLFFFTIVFVILIRTLANYSLAVILAAMLQLSILDMLIRSMTIWVVIDPNLMRSVVMHMVMSFCISLTPVFDFAFRLVKRAFQQPVNS